MSNGKIEVAIRQSRYAALVQAAKATGVSIEELVDQALTNFIEADAAKKAG